MPINIFEQAAKKKLRINSDRGALLVEQLYDLNLPSLDKIARNINGELKELTEESFISVSHNPRKTLLQLQLDILKRVIETKISEREAAETRAARANKRRVLLEALASKENEELRSLSKDSILKQLEEL